MPVSASDYNKNNSNSNINLRNAIDSATRILGNTFNSTSTNISDNNTSNAIRDSKINPAYSEYPIKGQIPDFNDSLAIKAARHSVNLFDREEINLYDKTYRFGLFNPYGTVTTTREFLFFTKPDLHIYERDDKTGSLTGRLVEGIRNIPFWVDLATNRHRTIEQLQLSMNPQDNFIHLLQNQVNSNLDIPNLSAETIDTATNMYGVGFSYRGSSEASDDGPEFSLEFKDGRWLDVYYLFKTYEEYETLKHHGVIRPWKHYIENKIIHDQFAIYKFLVDEDMETILYYGKFYGVMPKSLPRDVFSSATFDNGLSFTIDFKAAFYEDMKPDILADFNAISRSYYYSLPYQIDIYNEILDRTDNRPAQAAYVEPVKSLNSPTGFVYKLRWRGSDTI